MVKRHLDREYSLLGFVRNLFKQNQPQGFAFSRPLVLLQSDDWGRVGVQDSKGYEHLRSRGLRLGEHPYDFYTLETADDVNAVQFLLKRHHDSAGRSPSMVMNFCTANLDFRAMREEHYTSVKLLPLGKGLPGSWSRPGLFDAYRAGIEDGVFSPSLHGGTHFCPAAFSHALAEDEERARFLRLLWEAETPYIFWRMPWVGYEYWNPGKPKAGFLDEERQRGLIQKAVQNFSRFFGVQPSSACAPGCRANRDTHRVWAEAGIRVAENGTGSGLHPPHIDEFGILHLYRTIDFEPSQRELELEKYLEIASACFSRGLPVIISIHSINFHSTLKDFRSVSIGALDRLLAALETRHPELLYVNDHDLYEIVTEGTYSSDAQPIRVEVIGREAKKAFAALGAT